MQHRDDELHLLGHALRELLDALVPPVLNPEAGEPLLQPRGRLAAREPLEAGEEEGLLAHLHLLVEAALLGQVADAADIFGGDVAPVEEDAAAVGGRDAVDDADERRLAGAVGAQQAVDRTFGDGERDVVQSRMFGKPFRDVLDAENVHGGKSVLGDVPSRFITSKYRDYFRNIDNYLSFFDKTEGSGFKKRASTAPP